MPIFNNVNFSIIVDGKEVTEVESIKCLGINIQSNLVWDKHIKSLTMKAAQAAGVLYKFKNKFDTETKLTIYNALIYSKFNYLVIIYGCKKTNELKSLQLIQL